MATGGGRFLASRLSLGCRRALSAADFPTTSPLIYFVSRQAPVAKHFPLWRFCPVVYSSSVAPSDDVTVSYANGLPVVSMTLPSRKERCQFTLRPVLENVGNFLRSLQAEDRGIDRAAIYTLDGTRVAASTGIDILLLEDFKLVINEDTYLVQPPKREALHLRMPLTCEEAKRREERRAIDAAVPREQLLEAIIKSLSADNASALGEVRVLVQQMYTTLRIEEHQLQRERELLTKLDTLRVQIEPLEKVKSDLKLKAEKRTRLVLWGGLAYMATQFGFLARLTWWEYSWDIMEPVTYFVTYGSAIAMYAYFILTRQEYMYPDARDRQYLRFFHRHAEKTRFDLATYNKLKDEIAQVELDLKRLRDPLQLHLPTPQLEGKV